MTFIILTKSGDIDMIYANIRSGGNIFLKYMSEDLKREYLRVSSSCATIQDLHHPLITVEDVLRAYFILADYFTDDSGGTPKESMLVGLRSEELLSSALSRQIISFGGKTKYSDPIDICSTLFFGLAKNHAFLDGNKRVSLLVLLYQLFLYGYIPSVPEKDFEKLVVSVAANKINPYILKKFKSDKSVADREVHAIAYLLRRMVKKKDSSYHISATAKEFCVALNKVNVSTELENGKLKFRRCIKRSWPFKDEIVSYSIQFGGWSRVIGAKTARDVLQSLKLYDQYPSYKEFYSGSEPLYQMIQQFEGPLRRLKDE